MAKPTTVLDWLQKLPELGKFGVLANSKRPKDLCSSWAELFIHLSLYSPDGITAKRYWLGAFQYVSGGQFSSDKYVAERSGYAAAKAAFEQERSMPGKEPIAYIAVAPDDLEQLRRKAAIVDDLKDLFEDFESKLQDIISKL